MPFGTALTRMTAALDELERNVHADLRGKPPATTQQKRAMRSEIESCMQRLDELRTLLAD